MDKYNIIREVILNTDHKPTGNTKHVVYGDEMQPPYKLQIIKYDGDEGFYLLYFGVSSSDELTDTYHDSIDSALQQAEWEYGVSPTEWESFNEKKT